MPDVELDAVAGGSQSLRGYLATPGGDGPWPGVVAIHELFGLTDMVRRQADRLAAAGFLTLAPDLFSDGGMRRCVVSTFRSMLAGEGRPFADIEAARQQLLGRDDCTGKVGVIGFCMGGGFALVAATKGFDAAAPNYGALPRDHETLLQAACPIVASYGGKDVSMGDVAGKLERTLSAHDIPHDVKEYPTAAGHSYLNDEFSSARRPRQHALQRIAHLGPDPQAAPDAWRRIEAFLHEHLAA